MRDIAALVFGGEPGEECEAPDEGMCGGQPAGAGDWCQTPPGRTALAWLGVTHGGRESKRDRSRHGPFGMKVF